MDLLEKGIYSFLVSIMLVSLSLYIWDANIEASIIYNKVGIYQDAFIEFNPDIVTLIFEDGEVIPFWSTPQADALLYFEKGAHLNVTYNRCEFAFNLLKMKVHNSTGEATE